MPEPPPRPSYCLYCFADLATAAERCPNCARWSCAAERRLYWNRAPVLERLQVVLSMISLAIAVMASIRLIQWEGGGGTGGGGLYAAPLALHIALSRSIALLTRRSTSFRAGLFWPLLFLFAGPAFALLNGPLWLLFSLLAWPAHALCRHGTAWKRELVEVSPVLREGARLRALAILDLPRVRRCEN